MLPPLARYGPLAAHPRALAAAQGRLLAPVTAGRQDDDDDDLFARICRLYDGCACAYA